MAISVLIADAQPLLSESLCIALSRCPDLSPIQERLSNGDDVVEAVQRHRPDVVLLDYWMPGIDGPAASRELLSQLGASKVIFLSWFYAKRPWFDAPGDIERLIEAGAVGFLPKHSRVEQVADAVRRAHAGERPVLADALAELIARMRNRRERAGELWQAVARLTPREVEILQLLADGTSVREAAAELYISEATLRTHVQRALHKTGTHSQVAAIAVAREFGVIRG